VGVVHQAVEVVSKVFLILTSIWNSSGIQYECILKGCVSILIFLISRTD
jgi:hypothetical protein